MWLENRKEAGEACGLCTEVAEGPNNQDPVRMKTKKVVLGWIQLGRFNELESRDYECIPFPSEKRPWRQETHLAILEPHASINPVHLLRPLTMMGK